MTSGMANEQEPEKEEAVDEYKFVSVEVGDDSSVILPKGAIPLNAMYSPGTARLGVIALVPEKHSEEAETDLESSVEAEVEESAIGETTIADNTGEE